MVSSRSPPTWEAAAAATADRLRPSSSSRILRDSAYPAAPATPKRTRVGSKKAASNWERRERKIRSETGTVLALDHRLQRFRFHKDRACSASDKVSTGMDEIRASSA